MMVQQSPPPHHQNGHLHSNGSHSTSGESPTNSPKKQANGSGKMRSASLSAPQCPVVHHAPSQPLPPGHPPTHSTPASTLKAPLAERCVFYRTPEDLISTPPISRTGSNAALYKSQSTGEMVTMTDYLKEHANVRPLGEGESLQLDPQHALVLSSRNSQLALIQSSHVHSMLEARYGNASPHLCAPESSKAAQDRHCHEDLTSNKRQVASLGLEKPCSFPITSMSTAGDHNQRSPLYVIGGEGRSIWTGELEVALKAGAVDAIVHCLKDVPTSLPKGLELAAILEREDPRDALVMKAGMPYKTLDELPPGSVIGTSSVRRVAQLRSRYPKLVFSDVRGNINTRLAKLDADKGPYTALILAAAGLHRLSFEKRITAYLCSPVLYYSVGQGALVIEVRSPPPGATVEENRDKRILEMIKTIACWRSTWRCEAERALLRKLEGGCSIPVGVETWFGEQTEQERIKATAAEVKKSLLNGHSGEGDEEVVLVEGHSLREDVGSERPGLQRFETGQVGGEATPALPRLPTAEGMTIEDLSTPLADGTRLHLSSNVVSLDGTRRAHAYLSEVCQTVEQARRLGEKVAELLINDQVAKVILEEVERHRAMAEKADQMRRAERKERLKKMDHEAAREIEVGKKDIDAVADGLANGLPLNENGVAHVEADLGGLSLEEEQQKLMQVIGLTSLENISASELRAKAKKNGIDLKALNGLGGLGLGETPAAVYGGEVDRRFVPREDGQPKAWEV